MKEEVNNENKYSDSGESLNIQELIFRYLAYWPWLVASVIACLAIAYVYLKFTVPVYNISATIMIKDDKKGGQMSSEMSAFQDLGLFADNTNFDNEIEVLKAKSLIKQVVYELNTYCRYSVRTGFVKSDIYTQSPLLITMDPTDNDAMKGALEMEIKMLPDSSITVSGTYYSDEEKYFEQTVKKLPGFIMTPAGRLTVVYRTDVPLLLDEYLFVTVAPAISVAKGYLGSLDISPTSKTTSVATLSFKNSNKQRGQDFLNKLVEVYNRDTNTDKNIVGIKTEQFINDRIAIISGELGNTEERLESYKRDAGLTDIKQDAQLYLKENSEYEQKKIENGTQINLINYLNEYVRNPANTDAVIPANVGLQDVSLSALINTYNEQVLERDRLLRTSSSNNPVIQNLNTGIRALHGNILASITSVRKGLLITKDDIDRQAGKFSTRITNAPQQERILTSISRQQEIKSGLYLMLLQKREENSITMAATADNAKLIDAPLADSAPVSPKKRMIMMLALLLGLSFPVGILYLFDLLQYKIATRHDVEKLTTLPILGDVPLNTDTKSRTIVVHENKNNLMSEAFRSLRTNLQFMLGTPDRKVILFTSTSPGEGKTFVSTNMAVSLALLGKKVLMVGLDIRKPRLAEHFGFNKKSDGISKYLSGGTDDLNSLIIKSNVTENLQILHAGVIPPNPAELLASPRLEQAMELLRKEFDYILLDSAPVGFITDPLIAGRIADLSIYVCRSEVTHKSDFELVNTLHKEHKLPHIAIVVNAVDLENKRYGYAYGYGKYGSYGKKYGYGYRYGYADKSTRNK